MLMREHGEEEVAIVDLKIGKNVTSLFFHLQIPKTR